MSEPISWNVARKTASKVAQLAGSKEPFADSYLGAGFSQQMAELTAEAEPLVSQTTGLKPPTPAIAHSVDRSEWASVNIDSVRRLLGPVLRSMQNKDSLDKGSSGPVAAIGRNVTGVELGAILGWMSSRVMGQYDPLLFPADPGPQDRIYYVVPNIVGIEKRFAFPPEEFRLWLALHEVTHRAQFTGCSWTATYFKSLIDQLLDSRSLDPQQVIHELRKAIENRRSSNNNEDSLGPLAAIGGPERREALGRLTGLMSLLEGHAEVVMGRAGQGRVPNADRFHRVFAERRKSARGLARFVQKVLGMDAKMRQYEQGAKFVRAVESHGGEELFAKVWERSENCPTFEEIKDPKIWISRVG